MNAILVRLFGISLFQRESGIADPWQIIGWWETRRIPFNLIVGIVGILTIATGLLAMSIASVFLETPIERPDPPLFLLVFLYALVVNLFYTGGWLVELVYRRLWHTTQGELAVLSFRLGLLLTILVTLMPALFALTFTVYAVFTRKPLISP